MKNNCKYLNLSICDLVCDTFNTVVIAYKKMSRLYVLVIITLIFQVSGCATITRGTSELLVIESVPSGAVARLSNGKICITPCSIALSRKESLNIVFEKEGYEIGSATVSSETSGAGGAGMAGNVLIGGLGGIITDSVSGAAKSLTPNPVKIYLSKIDLGD